MAVGLLDSPLSIYSTVREYFPCASFRIIKTDPIELDIALTNNAQIRVASKVQAAPFIMYLLQVKMNCQSDLDNSRFSTAQPLSDLTGFGKVQRQIYESNGMRCVDAMINYLQDRNLERMAHLMTLGLSPDLLTNELAFTYFGYISKKYPQLIPILQEEYPLQLEYVIQESCKQELLTKRSATHYEKIFARLQDSVLGQEMAVKRVAAALAEDRQTKGNHRAFLFVGPTGVGKTELAMSVGAIKGKFIVFYMNQYPNEHDTTRFFGAPTSYLGSDAKPDLANELDKCPDKKISSDGERIEIRNAVLLFDELEKAHPKMRQSLLTILERGEVTISYTDSSQRSSLNKKILYKLTNCVVIATSNLFQKEILLGFQEGLSENEIVEMFTHLNRSAPSGACYSPELLGRVKTIPFGPIPLEFYTSILKSKVSDFFAELKKKAPFKEIAIEEEPLFFERLKDKLYGDGTDIRKVKKYLIDVQSLIISQISAFGDLADKKISFYPGEDGLSFKLYRFCYGKYVDLSEYLPPVSIEI